jgi:hypothetical protein
MLRVPWAFHQCLDWIVSQDNPHAVDDGNGSPFLWLRVKTEKAADTPDPQNFRVAERAVTFHG